MQSKEKGVSNLESLEFEHRNVIALLCKKNDCQNFEMFSQSILKDLNCGEQSKDILCQAFLNFFDSDNVYEAIKIVSKCLFCHYINSDILQMLARALGDSTSIEEAQTYEKLLSRICQEVHVEEFLKFNQPPEAAEDTTSTVLIKKNERWQLCYVNTVRATINAVCKLGGIPPFLCRLKSIRRGCVAMELLIPRLLAQRMFQHLQSQWKVLHDVHSIDQLIIDDDVVVNLFDEKVFKRGSILLSDIIVLPTRYTEFSRKDRIQINHCQKHHKKFYKNFVLITRMLMRQVYTAQKNSGTF